MYYENKIDKLLHVCEEFYFFVLCLKIMEVLTDKPNIISPSPPGMYSCWLDELVAGAENLRKR